MSYEKLFLEFRSQAIMFGYAESRSTAIAGRTFGFLFNQGDMYTGFSADCVYNLVEFAIRHAKQYSGDRHNIESAYGLLDRVASCESLNEKENTNWWSLRYEKDDPKYISVRDWLEMEGYEISA